MMTTIGLVAIGAVVAVLAITLSFRIGRSVTDINCQQLRITCRDMAQARKEQERQIDAVDELLGRMIVDPRTHPHTRLELERVRQLCIHREISEWEA